MPGPIRKLIIVPSTDGLVIQSHTPAEHHKAICIEYSTDFISERHGHDKLPRKQEPHIESHGIIGLLKIASSSFLITITGREQVAQIFGKPVYVVTDVVLLPLASQTAASDAIIAATKAHLTDDESSDLHCSDSEDEHGSVAATELATTPTDEANIQLNTATASSSIAKDVASRKGQYGKFASEWLSKQVWGVRTSQQITPSHSGKPAQDSKESLPTAKTLPESESESLRTRSHEEPTNKEKVESQVTDSLNSATISLMPRILRSVKMILSSKSFYFSYDFDLTRRLSLLNSKSQPARRDPESLYFYNKRMGAQFLDAGYGAFLMPIMQGFVGQRSFTVEPKAQCNIDLKDNAEVVPADTSENANQPINQGRDFLLTLISRRSTKRSGLRYLRRGIDDEGNCANAAETEQILSTPDWNKTSVIRSFVQVRGSIPLYFSQTPYALKPVPVFHNTPVANQTAFKHHFQNLKDLYGAVQIATLINKHGTEATIGEAYERTYKNLHDSGSLTDVGFEWFDFHAECRGMKFENVQLLVNKLRYTIASWGETKILNGNVQAVQKGVIRTNCMDCLDRTNVAQSAFGQHMLQQSLQEEGYDIDLLHDESTNWFNSLWADNGDAISRQYASTAALKGDFTRTRRRNWRGQMNDLGLTLSRYYSNMVNDYFSQAVIDVLLGNVSWRIFEDFESTMMSADPGISVASAREAAIENCTKIIINGENEDLIHGYTLLSPAQENTLRTLPFEETVVLLTDAAIYCCKFDWNTEKVASFEKIDLRSISKIRYGAYITSTFTERQLDEELNQGLAIVFTPGKEDVIRVNTRSLQNSIAPEAENSESTDAGTGVMSWFMTKRASSSTRTMALKVIPQDTNLHEDTLKSLQKHETPKSIAENISEEIRRAIEGPDRTSSGAEFLEKGDIISAADARKRTGYLEQLGHSLKKMVWT